MRGEDLLPSRGVAPCRRRSRIPAPRRASARAWALPASLRRLFRRGLPAGRRLLFREGREIAFEALPERETPDRPLASPPGVAGVEAEFQVARDGVGSNAAAASGEAVEIARPWASWCMASFSIDDGTVMAGLVAGIPVLDTVRDAGALS